MRTSPVWLLVVARACSVLVVIGLLHTVPAAAVSAASPKTDGDACVGQIGDVTGDGLADFSVSVPGIRNGAVVVYLIAGHQEPRPERLDRTYLQANLVAVLRGPAAMPFVCPTASVALGERMGARAKRRLPPPVALVERMGRRPNVRRRPPVANTLIDQPVSYTMVDLDPLMPGYSLGFTSLASGINAGGQVVGRFFTQQGEHAFVYDRGEVRDLGTLGGHISDARGINRSGQIVGYSLTGAVDNFGFINAAFRSDGFLMQSLNLDWSAASAINDAGQIVGEMRFAPGVDLLHAFLYDQGVATDLGSLPPLADSAYSAAHAINEGGQVVGQSNTFVLGSAFPSRRYSAVRAFLYEHGAMRDLGSLGVVCSQHADDGDEGLVEEECFENSVATDINNSGTIVGFSSTSTSAREHAFLSDREGLQDLGTLGGDGSWAYGVNDSVQIVGFSSSDDGFGGPFLYERGTMYDLNDLIMNPSGTMPFAAFDINNFGQIVGNHHVLHPRYEQVAPGRVLAFRSVLNRTFGFAYWVSRGNVGACHAGHSRLRLQVRFQVPGGTPGRWLPVDAVRGCGDSTDWQAVSVAIPSELEGKNGVIRIRVRERGPETGPSVYLRHFSME